MRPPAIDKGAGTRWLAERLGLDLAALAGVGDADPDLAFMSIVGHAAAPANATPRVRAASAHVASQPFGAGLLEIVDEVVDANQRLVSAG